MSRTARLRNLLLSGRTSILMEAHDGLSARLAQEAGFEALWGSGLTISAALGVRDANEASWTQILEVLEFMNDAVEIPILLDGDTGYGNFNNVRRLVRKLEQRGVAGVCLEDKLFPKTNSLLGGERQALADVDEFCGKLRAAKDTQRDADFVVVARTEAFIAGWGLDEALARAFAYAEHAADAILVHSRSADGSEILAFMEHWDNRVPVIVVPTTYPSLPLRSMVDVGVTNFIFANQSLRTVITALQHNLRIMQQTGDLMSVEHRIAPVDEIFRLQNAQELQSSEAVYLPPSKPPARAPRVPDGRGRVHLEGSPPASSVRPGGADEAGDGGSRSRGPAHGTPPGAGMPVEAFGDILRRNGIRHGTGVPCSFFAPLLDYMTSEPSLDYLPATSEGEAVAVAAGLVSAGRPAFALMQNSGLGNAVNPITSLLCTYGMPVVLLVSHRGEPGRPDEPQHELMGRITEPLARLCGLRTHTLVAGTFEARLREALDAEGPSAFVCRQGTLEGRPASAQAPLRVVSRAHAGTPTGRFCATHTREEALRALLPLLNAGLAQRSQGTPAVVATTGKLSRELYALDDRDHSRLNRFYMVGSMGCAAGFGLGVARGRPERPVVVLDGDGALLMKLGSLATLGASACANLHHVVLDNGAHDSTGGQPTVSPHVDFAAIASACGYRDARTVDDATLLVDALEAQLDMPGPTLLRMLVRGGSRRDLGRPTLTPRDGWQRFRAFLQSPAGAP